MVVKISQANLMLWLTLYERWRPRHLETTLADVKVDAQLYALAGTVVEVEAENLYETLKLLQDTLAKTACRSNWRHTERSGNQALARYATLHPNLGEGRGSSQHGGFHVSINKGRDTRRQ